MFQSKPWLCAVRIFGLATLSPLTTLWSNLPLPPERLWDLFITMKTILLIILAMGFAASASELGKLQDSFMARYDETNQERDDGLKKLESSYVAALERHLDKVKSTGKLERVIPVRDEIQAVQKDAAALPELPNSADRDLRKMREKFVGAREAIVESHALALVQLAGKMDELLKKTEADLTRQGKIDDALAAKRMRETLTEDTGIQAASRFSESRSQSLQPKDWIKFSDGTWEVRGSGPSYIGPIGGSGYEKLHVTMRQRFEEADQGKNGLFVTLAPIEFEIRFPRPVSELKTEGYSALGAGRKVKFHVIRSGETIKVGEVVADGRNTAPLDCKFEPTRKLTIRLEKEDGGGVWTALLNPRVR